ncbi:putative ion transporter superfamily protein YfcC [Ruminiclostridium sufflavum DSM 19573]|uniref:Putative ion transporter superfamily protein YfcC n=1 Tax=Ruminiclostridium sufflavum DSM 19573 TaxID=1121337 RepID=A0A318Y370_9FIRM|nr:YfcC family protein [Ruminiclostridium sufflavum]PYG85916.1 putative ion transporter superfamily protein YfcC [Ruminiclostridium sufflavum DSM 19573]
MPEEAFAMKSKKKIKLPHVYTIAFMLIVFFAILTWIIPSGQFERVEQETAAGTRMVAVAGSYEPVDKVTEDGDLRQGLFDILMAPTKGVQAASDVVAFVLLIGGSFALLNKTNAINAGMSRVIKRLKGKDILMFPIIMLLFGLGGTTFGMSEEALPFYAIFLPIIMSIGYDSMTAFMLCFMGAQLGYCASTVNPFNVLIAQGIAGIQGNPQLGLRFLWFVIFMALGIAWIMRYALKVKKNPLSSITYNDDILKRQEFSIESAEQMADVPFTTRHKIVLLIFAAGMGTIIWGLLKKGWYMDEISGVFLAIGLFSAIAGGLSEQEMAEEFVTGMKDFTYAAVIIGIARGILVIAEGGLIIDTILNSLATMLSGVSTWLYTTMMYFVLGGLTFLIPSSSGLASLTIPVLGPLTELMGVNPEASVTALQFSNQIVNTISPTAGMTVAGLAVCKISFPQWWKTCWKFVLLIFVLGIVFTAISGYIAV